MSSELVFQIDYSDGSGTPAYDSGFPVDMAIHKNKSGGDTLVSSRLTQGKYLVANSTAAEVTGADYQFDYMDGYYDADLSDTFISYMFRRQIGFFDVVCYTGDGVAGRTVNHNLGVVPEMIWVKGRTNTEGWFVQHKDIGIEFSQRLNSTGDLVSGRWNSTLPTSVQFTVSSSPAVNGSGVAYIAYLFATVSGISKCGSYTGNGTSQTIDMGFTTGCKFFLVKASSTTGDWHMIDATRGIVSGSDPYLELNTTNAEVASEDCVDPDTSGIIVNEVSGSNINTNGVTYVYYSIAN
jgi:hypothetical protein